MDRRSFLRQGACISAGLIAGFGLECSLWPGEAFARGAGSEESAKSKRIFDQLGGLKKGAKTGRGTTTLAPGDILTFECECFCLDANLALPSEGDPVAFRPVQNYIAPELRTLYAALMRNAEGAPDDIQVQHIIYTMRSSESERSSILKAKDYAFLNKIFSGGENRLKTAHRPAQYISPMGLSLWASKSMPPAWQSYSLLRNDGVAGYGIGLGVLSMRGVIGNGSQKNFVFDPTQWVLESSRDVQAAAIPLSRNVSVAKGKPVAGSQKTPPAPVEEKKPATSSKSGQGLDEKGFAGH